MDRQIHTCEIITLPLCAGASLLGGLCPMGAGGLCAGGLCLGVTVQGVTVQGEKGVSVQGVSVQMGSP